jgi:CHAT domain-containing protein/tetratricopeptide (TPR) repeat protein
MDQQIAPPLPTAADSSGCGEQLATDGRPSAATAARRLVVEETIRLKGERDVQTDSAREHLFEALMADGAYREAVQVMQAVLQIRRLALGPASALAAQAMIRLGDALRGLGSLKEARDLYRQSADVLAACHPPAPGTHATALLNLASVAAAQGSTMEAEGLCSGAICIKERAGQLDAILGGILALRGDVRKSLGFLKEAEADLRRGLFLLSAGPEDHPARLAATCGLAVLLRDTGRIAEGIPLLERTRTLLAMHRPPDDPQLVGTVRNLALATSLLGDHAKALGLINSQLGLRGPRNWKAGLHWLALLVDRGDRLADLGDGLGAAAAYEDAINGFNAELPLVWAAQERLAMIRLGQGDLETARSLLHRVLECRRAAVDPSPRGWTDLASTLLEMARFERGLGSIGPAAELLSEADAALKRAGAENQSLAAELWNESALQALAVGNADKALRCFQAASGIYDALGMERTGPAAQVQVNLARLLGDMERIEDAVDMASSALEVLRRSVPQRSPLRLAAAFNCALLFHRAGRREEAGALFQEALDGMEAYNARHAATVARDYVFLQLERERPGEALRLATQAADRTEALWRNVIRFASERERLAWRGSHDAFSALAAVAPTDPLPLARAVLRLKSMALDSVVADMRAAALADPGLMPKLLSLRADAYRLAVQAPGSRGTRRAQEAVDDFERSLTIRLNAPGRPPPVDLCAVQQALPPRVALVEFVQHHRTVSGGKPTAWLGAMVVTAANAPVWLELGPVGGQAGLAAAVDGWLKLVLGPRPPGEAAGVQALRTLHDLAWSRVEAALPPRTESVVIAPDGDLHRVSFASLWNGSEFLGERRFFRYVGSGRDLLAPAYRPPAHKRGIIVADVAYSRPSWLRRTLDSVQEAMSGVRLRAGLLDRSDARLPDAYGPLPFSAEEGRGVSQALARAGVRDVLVLAGDKATASTIHAHGQPFVLHFATHGQVLADWSQPTVTAALGSAAAAIFAPNPMQRSWVALSGANETLDAWRAGQVPDPASDGLLTAAEASLLPLDGTWLVTLSACETGLGPGQSGEGVFGFRRGFIAAGARHVLMALWPVQDDTTAEFMKVFYGDALSTHDAAGALARTQGRFLSEWRKRGGIARAARLAGPFVISSGGP